MKIPKAFYTVVGYPPSNFRGLCHGLDDIMRWKRLTCEIGKLILLAHLADLAVIIQIQVDLFP